MVTTWSTPRNKGVQNQTVGGQQNTANQQGCNNDKVPPDFARREERMSNWVNGAETYPALYEYDDVDTLSNVALFVRSPWFDTAALDQNEFCDRYVTNVLLLVNMPLRSLQMLA